MIGGIRDGKRCKSDLPGFNRGGWISISHTDKIAALGSSDARTTAQAIDGMRLDAVEHIQNLTLELTRLITSGEEPGEAESGGEPEGEGEAE